MNGHDHQFTNRVGSLIRQRMENDIDARTNEKQAALDILNTKIAITSDTLPTSEASLE